MAGGSMSSCSYGVGVALSGMRATDLSGGECRGVEVLDRR